MTWPIQYIINISPPDDPAAVRYKVVMCCAFIFHSQFVIFQIILVWVGFSVVIFFFLVSILFLVVITFQRSSLK